MKILLFGGTTEGRILATKLLQKDHEVHICVATEYGAMLLPESEKAVIHANRMGLDEMVSFMKEESFDVCIDATHPYAKEVSENIKQATDICNLLVYRLLRTEISRDIDRVSYMDESTKMHKSDDDSYVCVDSVKDAVDYLKHTSGNILVTTGSKELGEFTRIPDFKTRVFARVLSTSNVMSECEKNGFLAKNLFAMQGPFSLDLNVAMLKQIDASFLVTKASGDFGGFMEKCEAAKLANANLVLVGRPKEPYEKTYTMKDLQEVFSIAPCEEKKIAYIIGMGPGHFSLLTTQAKEAARKSEAIIGVRRCLDSMGEVVNLSGKKTLATYQLDEIKDYLKNENPSSVAFLYTGDIGFYSGATKVRALLDEYEVISIPGISSVHYLCDKVAVDWHDLTYGSMHGRAFDESLLRTAKKLALILGKREDVSHITCELCKLGKENVKIFVGENLSYENEKITTGVARDFTEFEHDPLAVMLIVDEE